jgi:hypothetical protein
VILLFPHLPFLLVLLRLSQGQVQLISLPLIQLRTLALLLYPVILWKFRPLHKTCYLAVSRLAFLLSVLFCRRISWLLDRLFLTHRRSLLQVVPALPILEVRFLALVTQLVVVVILISLLLAVLLLIQEVNCCFLEDYLKCPLVVPLT